MLLETLHPLAIEPLQAGVDILPPRGQPTAHPPVPHELQLRLPRLRPTLRARPPRYASIDHRRFMGSKYMHPREYRPPRTRRPPTTRDARTRRAPPACLSPTRAKRARPRSTAQTLPLHRDDHDHPQRRPRPEGRWNHFAAGGSRVVRPKGRNHALWNHPKHAPQGWFQSGSQIARTTWRALRVSVTGFLSSGGARIEPRPLVPQAYSMDGRRVSRRGAKGLGY